MNQVYAENIASRDVIRTLERRREGFLRRQRDRLGDELTHKEYAQKLPSNVSIVDEILKPYHPENRDLIETTTPENRNPELIDLGSGTGIFPFMAASFGMYAAGIEKDENSYNTSKHTDAELRSKGLLKAETEIVNGDFFEDETWNQLDRELEDFSLIVSHHPVSMHEDMVEYLAEKGPEDALYIFPEHGNREPPEGYEHSELNSYIEIPEDLYFRKIKGS